MRTTLNKKVLLAVSAAFLFGFTSCKKYEDGPGLSLRTKTARLTGEWELEKLDGESVPNDYFVMEFNKDGTFSYEVDENGVSFSEKGEWEWSSKKEEIDIMFDGSNETTTFEIKRLTNDEFWFVDEDNDEWELEKK